MRSELVFEHFRPYSAVPAVKTAAADYVTSLIVINFKDRFGNLTSKVRALGGYL